MENRPVSINFCFDVGNQYFLDQLKVRIDTLDNYINSTDFKNFAFSDFLDLLSEIYDSFYGESNFKIFLSYLSDNAGL